MTDLFEKPGPVEVDMGALEDAPPAKQARPYVQVTPADPRLEQLRTELRVTRNLLDSVLTERDQLLDAVTELRTKIRTRDVPPPPDPAFTPAELARYRGMESRCEALRTGKSSRFATFAPTAKVAGYIQDGSHS